ncbi:helix-turn-helix domain-containing protein [Pedobacter sp. UBA5917]|jgi:AraC-like DNA-binding protein|uniref:helix-turn-helix domain-containing protein n=1 Tax=Pedobacter sp. UBA5917 TaxID=1947061 RepID=UPI0025F74E6F|nr:AraC family transcriptional regulator [Pedobacter sp. UBA5917]
MKYIIFAGMLQSAISLLLLLNNRKKEKSDNILALLLIGIAWHLTTKFYIFTTLGNPSISTMMHTFIQLSYGPLLYLYAEKKNGSLCTINTHWYLFIPLIMSFALYGSVFASYTWYPNNGKFMLDIYNATVFPPIIATHFIFGFFILIKRRNKGFADHLLIRNLCLLLICLGISEVVLTYTVIEAPAYTLLNRSIIYILLGTAPVLVISNKFFSATRDWEYNSKSHIPEYQNPKPSAQLSGSLYAPIDNFSRKLLLNPVQHKEVFTKIDLLIKDGQRYKEDDISLEKLAAISGISRHYISETLNVFAKKSFYQYVNEYRIEDVVKTLDNNRENENLLAIAYRSGFKNKSSFNAYFKKIIGITPSEYIRNQDKSC